MIMLCHVHSIYIYFFACVPIVVATITTVNVTLIKLGKWWQTSCQKIVSVLFTWLSHVHIEAQVKQLINQSKLKLSKQNQSTRYLTIPCLVHVLNKCCVCMSKKERKHIKYLWLSDLKLAITYPLFGSGGSAEVTSWLT